jgi:hypothetical protein
VTQKLITLKKCSGKGTDITRNLQKNEYIEAWGRGTIKIIKECKQAGAFYTLI